MSLPSPRAPRLWRSYLPNNQGLALLAVLGAAFFLTLVVAGFLIVTSTHATTGRATIERLRARYASDAGISWIYTQLLSNPSYNPGTGPELVLPGQPQDMNVDITVQHNINGTSSKKIQSKVTYVKF